MVSRKFPGCLLVARRSAHLQLRVEVHVVADRIPYGNASDVAACRSLGIVISEVSAWMRFRRMHEGVIRMICVAIRPIVVLSIMCQVSVAATHRNGTNPPPAGSSSAGPAKAPSVTTELPDKRDGAKAADKAESLDQVLQDLAAKWKKIDSLKAEMKMVAKEKNAAQNLNYGGYGDYYCLKVNGKLLIRRDMVNTILPGPGKALSERKSTIITQEDVSYFLGVDGDSTFANKTKTDADEIVRLGGRALFDQLKRLYELKLQPDTEIEGEAIKVISGKPRRGRGRAAFLFSRDAGVMLQMTMESESGESSRTVSFSRIELNPSLEPSFFEFNPPPGVQVYDMTKLPGKP